MACLAGSARARATPGVVQNRPILTPGVENVAVSAATARSHAATSWQPPAVARPPTSAITGKRACRIANIKLEHRLKTGSVVPVVVCCKLISLRSCPLLNTLPSCRMTTTFTAVSCSYPWMVSFSAAIIWLDSAFLFLLSINVSVATPSATTACSILSVTSPLLSARTQPIAAVRTPRCAHTRGMRLWHATFGLHRAATLPIGVTWRRPAAHRAASWDLCILFFFLIE
mmetsp:Transcript_96543/g.155763  ORF Transcript_96543/g.155763 Transcript_96543/m.155763 type:complete len:228 (+) Transcript_96543:302-985(+)